MIVFLLSLDRAKTMKTLLLLGATLLAATLAQAALKAPPVVKTKNGLIAGYAKELDGGQIVQVYEGIRYGKLCPFGSRNIL